MSATKALYQSRIRERMDATGSTRWNTTDGSAGEIDPVMSAVFDSEWARILDVAPSYRVRSSIPTSDSSGRYTLTDMQNVAGDNMERLYRVLGMKIDGVVYQEVAMRDYAFMVADNPQAYVYWLQSTYLMALPSQASKVADLIWINHRPTRPDALSADSATIVFPDGYDEVVILETAAYLLEKGGAEVQGSNVLRNRAELLRAQMLSEVSRFSTKPKRFAFADYASDWGGI